MNPYRPEPVDEEQRIRRIVAEALERRELERIRADREAGWVALKTAIALFGASAIAFLISHLIGRWLP